jgi:hypothetical protein
MPTATAQRKAHEANRQRDHEAFESWQMDRWRRDEITDQSERLASPMENSFDYTLASEGLVTDLGEPLRPVFEDGYQAALVQSAFDPRWEFEAIRRGIELEELGQIEDYARALGEGVRMTSISLDGSDYQAMRAVAEALGHRLPVGRPSSEDILQNRMWVPEGLVVLSPIPDAVRVDGVDIGAYDKKRLKLLVRIVTPNSEPEEHAALIKRIRDTYDNVLTERTGQKHYAGRVQMSNEDAKTFIERQGGLLDDHMHIINKIFASTNDHAQRNRLAAPHRYNLSAALDDRLHGKIVSDLSSSGDNARAEGKTFDGDCPTSETATSAASQAERLGFHAERWTTGTCRNCERTTSVWKVEDGGCSVCQGCARAHTFRGQPGLDTERAKALAEKKRQAANVARTKKIGAAAARRTVSTVGHIRPGDVVKNANSSMRYEERLVIGGTVAEYVDLNTGVRSAAMALLAKK